MSNKNLLAENTIRRFMKLASLGPLSENYFDSNATVQEEEEEMGLDAEEAPAEEEPLPMDEPMEDEPEMGGVNIDLDQFMAAFEQALEQVTGEEVAVETGE